MKYQCEVVLCSIILLIIANTGVKADFDSVIVAIRVDEIYRCTGSILTKRTVLTTAACVAKDGELYRAADVDIIIGSDTMPLTIDQFLYEVIPATDLRVIIAADGIVDEHNLAMIALDHAVAGNPTFIPGLSTEMIDDPAQPDISLIINHKEPCEIYGWGAKGKLYEPKIWKASIVESKLCVDKVDKDLVCLETNEPNGMSDKTQGGALYCNSVLIGIIDCEKKGSCDEPKHPSAIRLVQCLPSINKYLNSLELRDYKGTYPVSRAASRIGVDVVFGIMLIVLLFC